MVRMDGISVTLFRSLLPTFISMEHSLNNDDREATIRDDLDNAQLDGVLFKKGLNHYLSVKGIPS